MIELGADKRLVAKAENLQKEVAACTDNETMRKKVLKAFPDTSYFDTVMWLHSATKQNLLVKGNSAAKQTWGAVFAELGW